MVIREWSSYPAVVQSLVSKVFSPLRFCCRHPHHCRDGRPAGLFPSSLSPVHSHLPSMIDHLSKPEARRRQSRVAPGPGTSLSPASVLWLASWCSRVASCPQNNQVVDRRRLSLRLPLHDRGSGGICGIYNVVKRTPAKLTKGPRPSNP